MSRFLIEKETAYAAHLFTPLHGGCCSRSAFFARAP